MKKHQEMMRDQLSYVESIGKVGQQHVRDALSDEGKDTVMRICLSPKDAIPLRALGYVAAAQYIQAAYLPKAQLQIIVPWHTIETANGISRHKTQNAAERLLKALHFVPPLTPSKQIVSGKERQSIICTTDTPVSPYINQEYFESVLQNTSEVQTLRAQAARRKSSTHGNQSYIHYFAGHIRMHDGVKSVVPYFPDQDVMQSQRIISIGAKSERPFYKARMAYRDSTYDPTLATAVGQIFTKHVLPPYQPSLPRRGGDQQHFDPVWDDLEALEDPRLEDSLGQLDSVVRDVRYYRDYLHFALNTLSLGESYQHGS